jgi:hypothetical protein
MENKEYKFEISLSVLNHLGRNLYRSFITVLGEAISNSWDADAKNVWIYIDRENNNFVIKDDGVGMDQDDFQDKFLSVGFSKRKGGKMKSPGGRPYIGAKGIGKLALLSCADIISIISKKNNTNYTGGLIDNSGLDDAIKHEVKANEYSLGDVNLDLFGPHVTDHDSGTIIYFEETKENIRNTISYLKKLIALHFKFSLIDANFNIYVEMELVTHEDLKEVAEKTEFVWTINNYSDDYIDSNLLTNKLELENLDLSSTTANGFIASVIRPSNLNITGSNEKAGIDLFVNGRLREKDILKHMPDYSTRFVASYLYGQIHFNDLDSSIEDKVFTSSREGVVEDNEPYNDLLKIIKSDLLAKISDRWDEWRLKHHKPGDEDNKRKTKKQRYARNLVNESASGYEKKEKKKDSNEDEYLNILKEEAEFNIPAYTDCFLSENILRNHIDNIGSIPTQCTSVNPAGQNCLIKPPSPSKRYCSYCKSEKGKSALEEQKKQAKVNIQIRADENNNLLYLDYIDLALIIDDKILREEDNKYKPLRNSVMHTSLLTSQAKTKLESVFDNVVATVKKITNSTN